MTRGSMWPATMSSGPLLPAGPPQVRPFSPWRGFANRARTVVLLAGLGGLLIALGSWIDGPRGATVGLLLGVIAVAGSYWGSDRLALRAARARPVSAVEAPWYHATVQELASRAGLPMPRLYVSPLPPPNAFATGRDPDNGAICVTEGLLRELDPVEVRAVLAHELAHVGNRDILITSVAAALATGISWLANVLLWLPLFGGSADDGHPNPFGLLVAGMLAPIAALLLQLAVSRNRELEADRTGAELLGDGRALARALYRIETAARRRPVPIDPAQATVYVVNPLAGRRVAFAQLFSTHPPTEQRIARLLGTVR